MSNTLKFGSGQWATKVGSALAYNDEDGNFKPLPFNFTRSTSGTRINKDGLIEVVTNNKPRIDFLNDSNGALLLEPQRTNLITYSSSFDLWSQSAVSITVNNNISPSGIQDADLITANGANTQHYIQKGVSQSAKTYSVFAKMGTQRYIQILTSGAAAPVANFDLQDGFANMVGSNSTASIEDFGNGWWRCILQTNDSLAGDFYINYASSLTMGRFGATTSSGTLYLWGAQAEVGNHQTSYIPTQGSAVTRVADVCNNAGNNQVINSTEGVLYYEGSVLDISTPNSWISVLEDANINNNQFNLRFVENSNLIQAVSRAGGLGQDVVLQYTLSDKTTINKITIKYKLNDWALWVNGIEVDTETSSVAFTSNSLNVLDFERGNDSNNFYGNVKNLRVYNTALNDSDLEELTSWDSFSDMANSQLYKIK